MAIYIPETVDVQVFLESASSTRQSFEFPLVAIPHNLSANNIDAFPSISSLTAAGAAINSPVYMFASGLFGGIAPPDLMKVARATVSSVTLTIKSLPSVDDDISLNANVNGVASVISYKIEDGNDEAAVATALAALLTTAFPASDSKNPTFAASGSVITATIPSDGYSASFGWGSFVAKTLVPHITVADVTSDSYVEVIETALSEDDNVAFILAETHAPSDVTALAGFAQASNKYQYKTSSNDVNCANSSDTSNIAYSLSLLSQNKVELMLSAVADTHFPEAAVIGGQAGISPARVQTANLLSLPSIPADNWTQTQRATLAARNTNYYVTERGFGTYREGYSMSGQFSDLIRFSLWMKESVEQSIFDFTRGRVNLASALSYSDDSARQLESTVFNNVIRVGQEGGSIGQGVSTNSQGTAINLDPIVDFGNRADQTDAAIATRTWENATVEVVYLGDIHHVKVNVYVVTNRQPQ